MVRRASEAGVHRIAPIVRDCVDPRRVLLFGSRARGDARADSDFDVYVELDDDPGTVDLLAFLGRGLRQRDPACPRSAEERLGQLRPG